jgi:thymidylate kinase
VIGDRWWYGYIAQPFSLRFYGPHWLATRSTAFFPQPELVIDLKAPVEVIASRKSELTRTEIRDELARWSEVAKGRRIEVDATKDPSLLAEESLAIIEVWLSP